MSSPSRPYIGVVPNPVECQVPMGALVLEMKYCEVCGVPFPREREKVPVYIELRLAGNQRCDDTIYHVRKDTGQRFCKRCRITPLQMDLDGRVEALREEQDRIKEQLPKLDSIHLSYHPIRWDSTVHGRQTSAHRLSRRPGMWEVRSRKEVYDRAAKTREAVLDYFLHHDTGTMEDLAGIIPECYGVDEAHVRVRSLKIKLRLIAYKATRGIHGHGMGIYVMDVVKKVGNGREQCQSENLGNLTQEAS